MLQPQTLDYFEKRSQVLLIFTPCTNCWPKPTTNFSIKIKNKICENTSPSYCHRTNYWQSQESPFSFHTNTSAQPPCEWASPLPSNVQRISCLKKEETFACIPCISILVTLFKLNLAQSLFYHSLTSIFYDFWPLYPFIAKPITFYNPHAHPIVPTMEAQP